MHLSSSNRISLRQRNLEQASQSRARVKTVRRSTCVPPPYYPLHISAKQPTGKSSQIAPLVRNRGVPHHLGKVETPGGRERERVRKAIDNSSNSSKVTEQGSARGYSTIKHGQINFKPVSSPFHQPTITINPSSSANTTTT